MDGDTCRSIRPVPRSLDGVRELPSREPPLLCALAGLGRAPLHFSTRAPASTASRRSTKRRWILLAG